MTKNKLDESSTFIDTTKKPKIPSLSKRSLNLTPVKNWGLECPSCHTSLTRLDLVKGSEHFIVYRCPSCKDLWRENI